jgi:hypothetical protein
MKMAHHGCKHTTVTPHVKTIVVFLEVYKQLRAFEIARRDTNVVFCLGMIKFGETPIDKSQLNGEGQDGTIVREITHFAMLMVNHDVMRFYVSMHDAF